MKTGLSTTLSPELLPLPEAGELTRPLNPAEIRLQGLLLEGLASGPGSVMDDAYFERLNERIRARSLMQK